jgi:hypothetical protein
MNLRITAPDAVELDGETGRVILDRATARGELTVAQRSLTYRLYGPFGQGYNFGVSEDGEERLTLEYNYRDGASIFQPGSRRGAFTLIGAKITDGVVTYGEFSFHSRMVSVKLGPTPTPFDPLRVAVVVALDVMFANRVLVFQNYYGFNS